MRNIYCSFFSDYPAERECLFIGGIPIMVITNIVNMTQKNEGNYRKYIQAINVINSIFKGTFNKARIRDIDEDLELLCVKLLNVDIDDAKDPNIPDYIEKLLENYCLNLRNIVILWDDVFGRTHQKNLHLQDLLLTSDYDNNSNTFFNLNILCNRFPNLEQIEYFKKSSAKKEILKLYDHIMNTGKHLNIQNALKRIIIHHKYSLLNIKGRTSSIQLIPISRAQPKQLLINDFGNRKCNVWTSIQYKDKVIIYNENDEIEQHSIY